MYNKKSLKAEEFINHEEIIDTLEYAQKNKDNIKLIDEILDKAKEKNIGIQPNIMVKSYINDIQYYLGAADLIISRAGALSVAESTVCGRALLLIPSPNVTGNHQYYNAKSVADHGGAILIEEKDLTSEKLIAEVMRLKNQPQLLEAMAKASKSCAPLDACEMIYTEIKKDV